LTRLTKAIMHALVGDVTDKEAVADEFANLAARKVGRANGVDFNRVWAEFTLPSGKKTVDLGRDIGGNYGEIWNVQEMWRTDVQRWPIRVVALDEFNSVARGGTATGYPKIATVYGKAGARVLEVYPQPTDDVTVGALFKLSVKGVDDVPDRYDDVIMSTAITLFNGTRDPNVAFKMARDGMKEIQADRGTTWTGSAISSRENFGDATWSARYDSGAIR